MEHDLGRALRAVWDREIVWHAFHARMAEYEPLIIESGCRLYVDRRRGAPLLGWRQQSLVQRARPSPPATRCGPAPPAWNVSART